MIRKKKRPRLPALKDVVAATTAALVVVVAAAEAEADVVAAGQV